MLSQHSSSKEKNMSYGHTWVKEDTIIYKWTIENFKLCLSKNTLKSPAFYGGEQNLSWYLQFDLHDIITRLHICKELTLRLFLNNCVLTDVSAKINFSILNNKGEKTKICETTTAQLFQHANKSSFILMTSDYIEFCHDKNGYLPYGTLTLFCEVTVLNILQSSVQFCSVKVPESSFLKDQNNILEEQKFCDITFSVGGREFKAHKNILSGRSSVFAAMFDHEFGNSKQNCVTITDVDHEVFEEILRFMYTDQTNKLESMADKLLIAADKYDLARLKVICEEVLSNKISIDNVCKFLLLADKHSANQLKLHTMNFIKNNYANVKNTVEWKNIKDNPLLLTAILERCVEEISLV